MKKLVHRQTLLFVALLVSLTTFCSTLIKLWPLELIASQLPLMLFIGIFFMGLFILLSIKSHDISHRNLILLFATLSLLVFSSILSFAPTLTYRSIKDDTNTVVQENTIVYATYNKLFSNTNLEDALLVLKEESPDIISFQEITQEELDYYKVGLGYEYSAITNSNASASESEIAVLSRFPIKKSETIRVSEVNEVLRSVVLLPDTKEIAVYSVHIFPPFTPALYRASLDAVKKLGEISNADSLPVLIAGDFNTTLYSPKLHSLFSDTYDRKALSIASPQSDVSCTWFSSVLCMRIDHILFSLPFSVVDYRIAEPTGSDHRIVSVTLTYSTD